jgi:hypothetical protein
VNAAEGQASQEPSRVGRPETESISSLATQIVMDRVQW